MTSASADSSMDFDAIVIGAGWAGMYMLHRLRLLGLRVRVLESGGGVGGTWYWNRYPGARCDIPILNYAYSFSPELVAGWTWSERYAPQPEIERYANYVADTLDLRRDIQLNARVASAVYDAGNARWAVTLTTGDTLSGKYCIMATGAFSEPKKPDIPGIDSFEGDILYTARWPRTPVQLTDKRVGVIGTGASGMQVISALAHEPVDRLYVFQRTASFATPAHNRPMDRSEIDAFVAGLDDYRRSIRRTGSGMLQEGPSGPVSGLSDSDFEDRMRQSLRIGGPSVIGGIADLLSSEVANKRVSEFLRRTVREQVKDTATADVLCANGYMLGARRILLESDYFEAYNQDHVTLVDVKRNPLVEITARSIRTTAAEYDLDTLILATGFDSGTGAVLRIDVQGSSQELKEAWKDGPTTYLGVMTHGFPNMFMIAGPGSPSIRSNVMVSIEQHVEWISEFVEYLEKNAVRAVEPSEAAEQAWTRHVADAVDATLLRRDRDTQYFGANVPGKPRVYLAYVGGVDAYRIICEDVRDKGYEGFYFNPESPRRAATRLAWSGPRDDGSISMRFGSPVI